jgi:ABC-type siderophore export system fused ATPase/permease subunit
MRALITTIVGTLAPVTAFAANGLSEDNSGMFVWVFLGFCALIVVAQIVPAVLLLTGMVKGVVSVVKEELAPAAAKN